MKARRYRKPVLICMADIPQPSHLEQISGMARDGAALLRRAESAPDAQERWRRIYSAWWRIHRATKDVATVIVNRPDRRESDGEAQPA